MELFGISRHSSNHTENEQPETSMDPVRGTSDYRNQVSPANPAETSQAVAAKHPFGHNPLLTAALLSRQAFDMLNIKEAQGNEQEKNLVRLAKEAIGSSQLRISPNQRATEIAQFGIQNNQGVLVIQAKLNQRSEYDVLGVSFRRSSGDSITLKLLGSEHQPHVQPTKMPPKNSLLGMPLELQQAIMGYVLTGSTMRQGTYDLSALENSNSVLKDNLKGDVLLKSKHDFQKKMIGAVNRLPIKILVKFSDTALFALASQDKIDACLDEVIKKFNNETITSSMVQAIEVLSPEQRTRLVKEVLSFGLDEDGDVDMDDIVEKGCIIGSLGKGLNTVSDHHAEIIDAVLQMPDSGQGWAIWGLGEGLHALNATFRDRLVQATLNMKDEIEQGRAIGGLAEGMCALTEQQRDAVFNAVLQFQNEAVFSHFVIPGLCKDLQTLTWEQQCDLANVVSGMAKEGEQSIALESLGPALKSIKGPHYTDIIERLSNSVLSIHSEHHRANALGSLGAGLQPRNSFENANLETHEQLATTIFDAVMNLAAEVDRSQAIAGLGRGLSAFSPEQRNTLVNACLNMKNETNKGCALEGLGAGLEALNHNQKEALVNASLSLAHARTKAYAIVGLGAALKALTYEQQAKLVGAAIDIKDVQFRVLAIEGLRNVENIELYSRLVDAALNLPIYRPNLVSPQARALASLIK